MGKAIVVYKSVYGSTKKYAEWIAGELDCSAIERSVVSDDDVESADIIIYGGGLYAGKISGIDFIADYNGKIKDKKIIIFTCGLADPKIEKNRKQIMSYVKKAVPGELMNRIDVFFFRGGIDYSKLSVVHRAMMGMLYRIIKAKGTSTGDENDDFIKSYGKTIDFTDKNYINPLIELVTKSLR